MTKSKLPFNHRPMCYIALAVCVLLVLLLWLGIWAGFAFIAMLAVGFAIHRRQALMWTIALVVCVLVVGSFSLTTFLHTNQRTFSGTGEIQGTIVRHNLNAANTNNFVLTNVTFNGTSVRGRTQVFIRDNCPIVGELVASGYVVSFRSTLRPTGGSDFHINNRILYNANVREMTVIGACTSVRSTVRRTVRNYLERFMSEQNAFFIYSMMFGDRSEMDPELRLAASDAGLAHVFSVSGMHVGLVIGILLIALKFLKIPRKYQLFMLIPFMLFYMYLCDFRFPVIRACIMMTVLLVAHLHLRKTDLLSSICLAGVISLVIFPYALMSVSFQMSYACMIGIALLYRPIDNFVRSKIGNSKPSRYVSAIIAIDLATTIAIFPVMLRFFGFYSLIGVIANLFLLAVIVLAFQLAVIAVFTVIGFPLLWLTDLLLHGVTMGINFIASHPWGVLRTGTQEGYFYLIYFAGLILLSRFVFIKPIYKYMVAATCFVIYTLYVLL